MIINMKKYILSLSLLFATFWITYGQSADPLVSKCVMSAGQTAKYLKDFRVQLGEGSSESDFRFKANMSLWKNTTYRFTMCNSDDSKGQLILTIKDNTNKTILSSFDPETGQIYSYVDLQCNKSGIYQLYYDFTNKQSGSAVGVVSMIR